MPSNQDPQNSGRFSRPIDAPSLPPWSKGREGEEEDETPTLSSDELTDPESPQDVTQWVQVPKHPAPAASGEDPRELARRLAEEAKKRLGQTPGPVPERQEKEPVKEDPRELARRLAEEAKQRVQQQMTPQPLPRQETAPPAEDPRELARRLAAEAKQRLTPAPAPEAKKRKTPTRRQSYTPPPLAQRAAGRPLSAAEALAKAREEEKRRATPAPTPAREAPPEPKPKAEPKPEPAPAPAPPPEQTTAQVLAALLPGAEVAAPVPVGNVDVFRALWRAHRARALHEKDLAIVATASVLLDAVDRVAPGRLVAARVTIDGVVWAAWADLDRNTLLGLAQPAEVYLAGT